MKIVELRAENVKRLQAVHIRPDGNVVTISGRNGQGKSSVLDAIASALGGQAVHQPEMIRRGETHAQVVLDLGPYEVVRRWQAETAHMKGGTTLEVRSKDGGKYPSPQTMLSKLYEAICLDPHGFLRLDKAKQLQLLKRLLQLDTSQLDNQRQAVVERRTEAERRVRELGRQLEAMPKPSAEGPVQRVDVGELLDEQSRRQNAKAANDKVRGQLDGVKQRLSLARQERDAADELVTRLEKQLGEAEARMQKAMADVRNIEDEVDTCSAAVAALVDPDVTEVYQQLKRAEATNELAREDEQRAKLQLDLSKRRDEHQVLDAEVGRIDKEKAELLAAARFPVDGLGFGADGLTWNGLPFEQASAAEQLRVSAAMAIAMNPKLRVILVRDGSLLDSQSLQLLAELADKADMQVWVERVADGTGTGVVIEDGLVLEQQEASTDAA